MSNHNRLKRRWAETDEVLVNQAVDALLKVHNGRKFLWWLLEIGRVGMQPYSQNALNTAFSCGELNVGQRILDRITSVSPDGYVIMMKENVDERNNRDAALRGTDSSDARDSADDFGERVANDGASD